jgi:hypothetical protein
MSETTIPKAITFSINLDKIDKNEIIQGEKGRYLKLRLSNTPNSEYGYDYLCAQQVSKEAREAGKDGNILGNGNAWDIQLGSPNVNKRQDNGQPAAQQASSNDDLPF